MDTSDFYDEYIAEELDDYVSKRFEKICEQYLIKNYQNRNKESISAIGRYWYNDKLTKTDIEIDQCVKTKNHIHIYECKWTKDKIGKSIMDGLKEKGKHLKATLYGAFSKSGFTDDVQESKFDLISLDNLFNQFDAK